MITILPLELFDAVLDYVHILDREARAHYYAVDYRLSINSTRPRKTLLSCSLVCQFWLHHTRLRTFNTVCLPYYEHTIGVKFGALVAHPLCTFRSHVRRLSLHECYNEQSFWLNSVFPQLGLLTNVQDVSIYSARFHRIGEEEWRAGVRLFGPHLKRLVLQSSDFDHVGHMTELISRCTNLEHLSLRCIKDWYSAPWQSIVKTPSSRSLRSLTIKDGIGLNGEFLDWLCPSPGSIGIPAVELEGIGGYYDVHPVSRFLYNLGPSITSLSIGFVDSTHSLEAQAFSRDADLTTLSQLEILQFGPISLYSTCIGRAFSAKHIPRILAKLNSPSLKEIQLDVVMSGAVDLELIDWGSIVPILNSASYPALEVLSFVLSKVDLLEETKAWLKEHVRRKLRKNVEIQIATTY